MSAMKSDSSGTMSRVEFILSLVIRCRLAGNHMSSNPLKTVPSLQGIPVLSSSLLSVSLIHLWHIGLWTMAYVTVGKPYPMSDYIQHVDDR